MSSQSKLPRGWAWTTLGDITWPKVEQTIPAPGSKFFYIDIGSIDNELKVISSPKELLAENAPSRARQLVKEGDVLVSMTRPNLNSVAIVPPELDGSIASTGFDVLRGIETESAWILANVSSDGFVDEMVSQVQGALYPAIRPNSIRGFSIPLPPRNEQRRIAKRLNALSIRCRSVRESLRDIPLMTSQLEEALFSAAFSGRLTSAWRENNSDIESADEILEQVDRERIRYQMSLPDGARRGTKGSPNSEGQFDFGISLPEGWRWTVLGRIASLRGGITKGKKRRSGDSVRAVPYLRVANVQRGYLQLDDVRYIDATDEEIEQFKLLPGDILFNEGGDRDKVGRGWIWRGEIEECIHQNHIFRARLYAKGVEPEFLSLFGNSLGKSYFWARSKQTTNLASINISNLSMLPVPIPPAAEQQEIVRVVNEGLKYIRSVTATCEAITKQARNLDREIFRSALTGRLVPQNYEDEPADVLLSAIAVHRAALEVAFEKARASKKTAKKREERGEEMKDKLSDPTSEKLVEIMQGYSGRMMADDLWIKSGLDIDDFYAALKIEVEGGLIIEKRSGVDSYLELVYENR